MHAQAIHPSTDNEYEFDYDLCLVSLAAVSFYEENEHRLNEVTLSEYSSHAIELIDRITDKGHVDGDLGIMSEMMDITNASTRAKDNIARARNKVEGEADKSRAAQSNGGFWWFYKQVAEYTLDTMEVTNSRHRKPRPTQDIYDHLVDVSFSQGKHVWGYKTHIREHKEIKVDAVINQKAINDIDLETTEGMVFFMLGRIARVIALDRAVSHIEYMASESPTAKRAKAIANFLKGDYKNSVNERTAFDELEIIN